MKIHQCFLWNVLFSFFCGFAMEQDGAIANVPQAQNGVMKSSAGLPIMHTFYQTKDARGNGICYSNRTAYNMQKFLEDAAHKEVCKTKMLIKRICDQIDKNIGPTTCFILPFIDVDVCSASQENAYAIKELQKIESYVPAGCSSQALYRALAKEHVHVEYLINRLARVEAEQFGSAADAELSLKKVIPGLSQPLSELIKKRAQIVDRERREVSPGKLLYFAMMTLILVVLS